MKMTTAAKQAESARDSWSEADRQRSMVPQAKTQSWSSQMCHTQTDNRGLNAQLMWMETLEGGTNENKLFMCAINPQFKLRAVTLKETGSVKQAQKQMSSKRKVAVTRTCCKNTHIQKWRALTAALPDFSACVRICVVIRFHARVQPATKDNCGKRSSGSHIKWAARIRQLLAAVIWIFSSKVQVGWKVKHDRIKHRKHTSEICKQSSRIKSRGDTGGRAQLTEWIIGKKLPSDSHHTCLPLQAQTVCKAAEISGLCWTYRTTNSMEYGKQKTDTGVRHFLKSSPSK